VTPLLWAVIAGAGAAGAVLRHELTTRADDGLTALHLINVAGAGLLGLLLAAAPGATVAGAGAAGVLGAFTSFSTWVVQARGRPPVRDLALPMAAAIVAAMLGTLAGRALGGTP